MREGERRARARKGCREKRRASEGGGRQVRALILCLHLFAPTKRNVVGGHSESDTHTQQMGWNRQGSYLRYDNTWP